MTEPYPIADNYYRLQEAIAAAALKVGRNPATVKLVGASKTVSVDRLREAVNAGLSILGENYLQEASKKIAAFDLPVTWHFIGHLQSNKAAAAVKLFELIHSVDRLSLAQALNQAAARINKFQDILLEVNLAGESSKSGVHPKALADLWQACLALPHLRVRGLMAMPPYCADPERVRPFFQSLRQARDRLQTQAEMPVDLIELSMGMSGDFQVAIEEGATLVRIGTALFGPRPH